VRPNEGDVSEMQGFIDDGSALAAMAGRTIAVDPAGHQLADPDGRTEDSAPPAAIADGNGCSALHADPG
jgi:hypothetical protein